MCMHRERGEITESLKLVVNIVCVYVCVCIESGKVTESLKLVVNILCVFVCVYELQEEVTESLKLANIDKDGKIDYKEFAKVLVCCVINVLLMFY